MAQVTSQERMQSAQGAWEALEGALEQARQGEALRREVIERGHLLYKRGEEWSLEERQAIGLQVVALMTQEPPVSRPSRRTLGALWRASGEGLRGLEVFQAAAVLLVDGRDEQGFIWDTELYMHLLQSVLGGRLAPLVAQALMRRRMHRRAWLYRWLQQQDGDWRPVHLHLLEQESSRNMREQAALLLLRQPEAQAQLREATERLASSRQAADRALAVFVLRRMETEDARALLVKMQRGERALSVSQAIKEALASYTPAQRALREVASQEEHGAYRLGQALQVQEGLERLRFLLHEEATPVTWCRICNLLERLRLVGALPVALDYLRPAAPRWPREHRLIPWSWRGQPELEALEGPRHGPVWLPVEVFWRDPMGEAVQAALREVQGRAQVRLLDKRALERFAGYLEAGWAWCLQHQVAPEMLSLVLDAGAPDPSKTTSAVETWLGYGVLLRRGHQWINAYGRQMGLRRARVELEPDHPARETFLMSRRKKYLDLMELEILS